MTAERPETGLVESLKALAAKWRSEIGGFRRHGQYDAADSFALCADELDKALASRAAADPPSTALRLADEIVRALYSRSSFPAMRSEVHSVIFGILAGEETMQRVRAILSASHQERPTPAWTIECPCCGDDAAFGGPGDRVTDGQALACGCKGHISVDAEGIQGVYADDCDCAESLDTLLRRAVAIGSPETLRAWLDTQCPVALQESPIPAAEGQE